MAITEQDGANSLDPEDTTSVKEATEFTPLHEQVDILWNSNSSHTGDNFFRYRK
jgi:hypothetical protein